MNKNPPRYAQEEGLVGLCFDDAGEHIITCGSDGDVRIFAGFEDDDPLTHRIGESVYTVAYKNYRFYTASDDNAVQIRIFKEGEPDGILTRCTAPINSLCFTKDGKTVAVGSSDFTVKLVTVEDNSQKAVIEHAAPVMHLAINPQETLLASSSCDGTVKVYSFNQGKVIHTITGLPKSNDMSTADTFSRMCWDKSGQHLCVPVEKEVKLYCTDNWKVSTTLTHPDIKNFVSIVTLSPCGKFLAASTQDGCILIFEMSSYKCIAKDQHGKKLCLTGIAWKPRGKTQLAWVDNHGSLGIYEDFLPTSDSHNENPDALSADQLQELFDDVDDDMLMEATNAQDNTADSDDDDVIGVNKSRVTKIQDDDDSNDMKDAYEDDAKSTIESTSGVTASKPAAPVVVRGFEPTPLQKPFQPGSTPVQYAHRFMVWNSVGVVLQYSTEDENSINIEFHDTATHHALHVPNSLGHTMADLSLQAAALACPSDEDTPSKLVCMHYSCWDSRKEWSVPMPEGEDIEAVTLGDGWVAAVTSKQTVRLFSVGGLQREVLSIPGPVVAAAGHENQLVIVYHKGMGIPGNQHLGVRLVTVTGKKGTVLAGDDLPISPKSLLSWLGFSAEGTPFTIDSAGIVRMLNRKMGNNWFQVCNLRKHIKGKSDNYFVVGIHENPQQIRAILCKGGRYPPTLPRPNVNILPFEIPLCEMSTEKAIIEESYWRSVLLSQHFDWFIEQGFEFDEHAKSRAVMQQPEALMKQFALACKSDREYRAMEVVDMMQSSHAVQLAIKYASRVHRVQLASKLSGMARALAEEEYAAARGDDGEEETLRPQMRVGRGSRAEQIEETEADVDMEEEEGDLYEQIQEEQTDQELATTPVLKLKTDKEKSTSAKSISFSQNAKVNPFKVASQKTATGQGSKVFDSIKPKILTAQKNDPLAKRPRINRTKSVEQKKETSVAKMFTKCGESIQTSAKSGFQLWFDKSRESLEEEHPDLSETELTKEAAKSFKELPSDEKKAWNEKAKTVGDEESKTRKRKQPDENQENNDQQQNKAVKVDNKPLVQSAAA